MQLYGSDKLYPRVTTANNLNMLPDEALEIFKFCVEGGVDRLHQGKWVACADAGDVLCSHQCDASICDFSTPQNNKSRKTWVVLLHICESSGCGAFHIAGTYHLRPWPLPRPH